MPPDTCPVSESYPLFDVGVGLLAHSTRTIGVPPRLLSTGSTIPADGVAAWARDLPISEKPYPSRGLISPRAQEKDDSAPRRQAALTKGAKNRAPRHGEVRRDGPRLLSGNASVPVSSRNEQH